MCPGRPVDDGGDSAIVVLDRDTGRAYATAAGHDVVLSSSRCKWTSSVVLEVHRMRPHEYDEHVTVGHQLMVNLGDPVRMGWREGDRRREATFATGALCIQSDGDANAPRWNRAMTFATASIPPALVATLLGDRAPTPGDTFPKLHCVDDAVVESYVRRLVGELSSPTEALYAETLSHAFVLHLLRAHGQGRTPLVARGKLQPAQLRIVVELAHEQLASDLSIETMAAAAGYSPFQFARLFKATTGLAPHRFVLRLRLERATRLLRLATPIAQVALLTGFYDQSHFTNVFRRAFGTTPASYARHAG